jgi:chromosome segregation ATPase
MSTYEAWRATFQDAEAAAKAAFEQVQGLAKLVDGLQGALGRQVRFGSEAGNPASGAQDKMPPTQQPEALRLAELIRLSGALPDSVSDDAASELRRLHAENHDLRTRHYCNTAEIESLQARVQELGEMARENRSKRIVELEGRIAELEAARIAYASEFKPDADGDPDVGNIHANIRAMKAQLSAIGAGDEQEIASLNERLEASQKSNADWAARTHALEAVNAKLRAELDELTEQMAAIGAGGVEPLRKRASTVAVVVQEKNQVDQLFDAVLTCPHSITAESVTLRFTPKQEGHNALSQLRHRLAAYDQAARQREMQLLSEIEALERLALANLKQRETGA